MPDLPSHASPVLAPQVRPSSHHVREWDEYTGAESGQATPGLPAALISPAFTPPSTPGLSSGVSTPSHANRHFTEPRSVPVDTTLDSAKKAPRLLNQLPHVECVVRARIPLRNGVETHLCLYENNVDNKEHLAIVFGNSIRSKSLDRVREGETEYDRMIRGAYVGRLRPGRTSSKFDDAPVKATNERMPLHSVSKGIELSRTDAEFFSETNSETKAPLVRIHSECYTGETAWSARCDCGEQLDEAARLMSLPSTIEASGGVIVYLRQEGRGIGLLEKLKAYNLQDLGNDTVEANLLLRHPADARSYGLATAILMDLGCDGNRGIRLLTNNPDKVRAVEGPNREIRVRERVAMTPIAWKTGGESGIKSSELEKYLNTKIGKMGHMLER